MLAAANRTDIISLTQDGIGIQVSGTQQSISLSIPRSEDVDVASRGMIGFGFYNETSKEQDFQFRVQSVSRESGQTSSMLIASAPLQVTLVQYSSDIRIKKDIESNFYLKILRISFFIMARYQNPVKVSFVNYYLTD